MNNDKKGTIFVKNQVIKTRNMIKEINHNLAFLSQKAEPATEEDKQVMEDLLDTLRANLDRCVGMAANMIGVNKNIIAICQGNKQLAMMNVRITKKSNPYNAQESCLSIAGVKGTIRYKDIEVEYQDQDFVIQKKRFTGFVAQIIQHEVDHCDGILI